MLFMIKHIKYGAEPKGLRFMNLEREENPSQLWLGKMSIIAREITACLANSLIPHPPIFPETKFI